MKTILSFDIGGTNIRAGLFNEKSNKPIYQKKVKTSGQNRTPLENIIALIDEIQTDHPQLDAISLAVPGNVDDKKGIIIQAPNVGGWKNIPLRQIIQDRFNITPSIENDASMAAYGEWKHGAGKNHQYIFYMTISTGIGAAVIDDGHLITGFRGLGTEKGHMTILDGGPVCSCGKRGHLEALASGPGIAAYVHKKMAEGVPTSLPDDSKPTAELIASAAKNGDQLSIDAFQMAGYYLGVGIANYLHIFNPSCIILGGGVSFSGNILMEPLMASLKEHVISQEYLKEVEITPAQLGDDAGLIGAFQWSMDHL
ncbi:MAG: Glucokinase [Anaerolinea thermophila]|uniref:Glucokinase n=1 Tax=Anaerolinea thermophila TaxID=167964 RepID=A0A124FN74_9CHLR|nr:MAG: Glucokinase [Anaerolinea thermophila]